MTLTVGPNTGLIVDGDAREQHYLDLMRQWRGLDGLIQCHVKDKDLNAPPGSPANGDMYIVGPAPTGAWAGQSGKLTRYFNVGVGAPGWEFFTPKAGWQAYVEDEAASYEYTGSMWAYLIGRRPVAASASTATVQPIVSGGSQAVVLEVEQFDYGSFYDPSTSRFTPPAGLYTYDIGCGFFHRTAGVGTNFPAGKRLVVQLNKNGTAYDVFNSSTYEAATNICRTSGTVEANGTDYFEMRARQDSGNDEVEIVATYLTRCQMVRIGGLV